MERIFAIMNVKLILTIIQVVVGLVLSGIILLQSGKRSGLSGAIAGGADTFMTKAKATTLDGKLAKATKWIGLAWVIMTIVLVMYQKAST